MDSSPTNRPELGVGHALAARCRTLLLVSSCLSLCACAGSRGHASTTVTTIVGSPSTPATFGGIPGAAEVAQCTADARTAQEASDTYLAARGQTAPSLDALVADGELRQLPATGHGYVITYDRGTGRVTATGACHVSG